MYKLINTQHQSLCSFHSNGGWEMDDVFPCGKASYVVFKNRKEAEEYITYMVTESEKQRSRWQEWTDQAIQFIHRLTIVNSSY